MKPQAIFFDRDGTLIVDKNYLNEVSNIEYLPGVFEGLSKLSKLDVTLFIATNQSGVARGLITEEQLTAIHQQITDDLGKLGIEFKEIFVSPHPSDSNHPNRKPNPGMIATGITKYGLDPKQCWMVGDKSIDIVAGQRAGVQTGLLLNSIPPEVTALPATTSAEDFLTLIKNILALSKPRESL